MKITIPIHSIKKPKETPRFGENQIVENKFETPQHSINDVSIGAD